MEPIHVYPKEWEQMMQAEHDTKQKEESDGGENVDAVETVASGSAAD
jgi:hypothetical protein